MVRFALRRLGTGLAVLLVTLVALTLITRLLPGDPATAILGPRATPELVAGVRADLHLDEHVLGQVVATFADLLRGDFGTEWASREPVLALLGDALPSTLVLTVVSLLFAAAIGIPLGVSAASRPGSLTDRVTGVCGVTVMSVPGYVIALILLLVFVQQLRLLPGLGEGSPSDPADYLAHLVLPTVALGIGWAGYLARLVRSTMLEQLGAEYVDNARAFGLAERIVLYRYVLRNAMVPVIAVLGSAFGYQLASTILVEQIFNRPGIGMLLVDAVENREWAVVRGCALVFAVVFVLGNTMAEIGVRALDRRAQLGNTSA